MRLAALTLWLTVLWVVLWGDPTLGNLVGGLVAAAVVLVLFPLRHPGGDRHTLRPLAALRLAGWFAWQLVLSNLAVAREALTPGDTIRTGIVAVPIRGVSPLVTTVVADAITLTPGTLTLDVDDGPPRLYVHVLHLRDPAAVAADVHHLEELVVRALGPASAVARLSAPIPPLEPAPSSGPDVGSGGSPGSDAGVGPGGSPGAGSDGGSTTAGPPSEGTP